MGETGSGAKGYERQDTDLRPYNKSSSLSTVDRKSLCNMIPIRSRERTTRFRQAGCPAGLHLPQRIWKWQRHVRRKDWASRGGNFYAGTSVGLHGIEPKFAGMHKKSFLMESARRTRRRRIGGNARVPFWGRSPKKSGKFITETTRIGRDVIQSCLHGRGLPGSSELRDQFYAVHRSQQTTDAGNSSQTRRVWRQIERVNDRLGHWRKWGEFSYKGNTARRQRWRSVSVKNPKSWDLCWKKRWLHLQCQDLTTG